jgi:hypothetical protein
MGAYAVKFAAPNNGSGKNGNAGSGAKGSKNDVPKGFKETKKFGYQHGEKVYEYKGKFYSRDVGSGNGRGSHNGGVWKVFEEKNGKLRRIGTADEDLNIFKK